MGSSVSLRYLLTRTRYLVGLSFATLQLMFELIAPIALRSKADGVSYLEKLLVLAVGQANGIAADGNARYFSRATEVGLGLVVP